MCFQFLRLKCKKIKILKNKIKNIASYVYPLIVEQCSGNVSPYLEVNLVNGKYVLDTAKVNYSYGSLYKIFDQTFHKFNLKSRDTILLY